MIQQYNAKLMADEDAEAAVLGAILWSCGEAMADVVAILPIDRGPWFTEAKHNDLYSVLVDMWAMGQPIDILLVERELAANEKLDSIGGRSYLLDLWQSCPNAKIAGWYAGMVRDCATRRRGVDVAGRLLEAIGNDYTAPSEILDRHDAKLRELREAGLEVSASFTAADLEKARQIADGQKALPGLSTGLSKVDQVTLGLRPGQLIVIAGRPGMGKSSLALNIAHHVSLVLGHPVWFVSLEMQRDELLAALACIRAGVNQQRLANGQAGKDERDAYVAAVGEVARSKMYVERRDKIRIEELRSLAERKKLESGIVAVFVDYLQLLTGPKSDNRQQEVAAISRGLKAIALGLELPVVALSQLNRVVEGRASHRPYMSDLRDSGAIEQDADIVGLLHRPAYYGENSDQYLAELDIAKNRRGPTGVIQLHFEAETTSFHNYHKEPGDVPPRRVQVQEDFIPG